ncbi:hypothetical protein BFU36_08490 [Sulfolobus sp. A20]|uniref:HEPN domain-containing protein n=1 Tax=Sulfolobaceae TaxID=118883 RepID=UPI0008461E98|nr:MULTISPECIES: HEPN domain-containing protein [unclassified Sulfolobus]TRM77889.1 HEPN domain-containing protein [Sulfolobus sp. A20-N-F8]TRM86002.1 HEPN domain-containing protein [Sulfolobus sp. C3]TRM87852.1 HEPN domain-containing protein [Sulfolobus sp. E3]TRM98453.1 HEPN domain-containing protein [Sulfolobus sp. F1]TRN02192.1 HEPN domain-containing protein [Sulfolobus sp. E1]
MDPSLLKDRAKQLLDVLFVDAQKMSYDTAIVLISEALYLYLCSLLSELDINNPWSYNFQQIFKVLSEKIMDKKFHKIVDENLDKVRLLDKVRFENMQLIRVNNKILYEIYNFSRLVIDYLSSYKNLEYVLEN